MRFGLLLVGATLCGLVTSVLAQALETSCGCTATITQFISTTVTATVFDPASSNIASLASPIGTISSLSTLTSFSTLTSYSTLTNFITVYPSTTSAAFDPSASAYYYADINGSTSWFNGITPPSTYHSLITRTIQITVYPTAVDPSENTMTIFNTQSASAVSAAGDPGASRSTITSYLTRTSISTIFMPASNSAGFSGPGSSGWNVSSGWNSTFGWNGSAMWNVSSRWNASGMITGGTITGGPVTLTRTLHHASSGLSLHPVSAAGFSPNATGTSHFGFNSTNQGSRLGTGIGSGFYDPAAMASTGSGYYDPGAMTSTGSQLAGQNGNQYTADAYSPHSSSGVAANVSSNGSIMAVSPFVSVTTFDPSISFNGNQTALSGPTASQYYSVPLITGAPLPGDISSSPSQTMADPNASSFGIISVSAAGSAGNSIPIANGSGIRLSTFASTVPVSAAASFGLPVPTSNGSCISLSAFSSGTLSQGGQANMTTFATSLGQSLSTTRLASRATSSTLSSIFTNATSGSMPTPSVCGEHGDFVLTWDDEPTFSPTNPITDPSDAPPVFNPYHHLYFSNGYVYIPPPRDPFPPISAPRLVMFLTNETGPSNNVGAGGQRPGEIGAGNRASNSAFWFNAYSAYLGCDNEGPDECTMKISGYVYQGGQEVLAYQHNTTLPACPGYKDCKLQQVTFPSSMVGLSGVQIQAFVKGEQRLWYMDNLALGWYNNTCAAGLLRVRSI